MGRLVKKISAIAITYNYADYTEKNYESFCLLYLLLFFYHAIIFEYLYTALKKFDKNI